jgi:hypothetical protein
MIALQLHLIFALDGLGPFIFVEALAGEDLNIDNNASTPGGTVSDVSLTSPAYAPKMARRSFSSGVS